MSDTDNFREQLYQLFQIQKIDLTLQEIEEKLAEIPLLAEDKFSDFNGLNNKRHRLEAERQALDQQKNSLEMDLAALKEGLQQKEARLYSLKTNKEYQASVKEISEAKEKIKEGDAVIIANLEKIEKISSELTQLSELIADKESDVATSQQQLTAQQAEFESERKKLLVERTHKVEGLKPELLRYYERIHGQHSNPLASAINGACSGCDMRIAPRLVIEMQKWQGLVTCSNCGRVLVGNFEGMREEESTTTSS